MSGHPALPTGSPIVLDPAAPIALYRQLYDWFRQAILAGRLPAGARLPATRALASELRVSRTTVVSAFEQLRAEGYIEGIVGSGSYVADVLPDDRVQAPAPATTEQRAPESGAISRRGGQLAELVRVPPGSSVKNPPSWAFVVGVPAVNEFPRKLWEQLTERCWRELGPEQLGLRRPGGYPPLRRAIAAHLRAARGMRCDEQQVIVVAGSQQALALVAHMLLDPGDAVWVENPGYPGARLALAAAGARLISVPVDAEGLDIAAGTSREPAPRLAYVTPSHQFPLGATMSLPRRLALLDLAQRTGAWILEDDYDSEYHYGARPLPALQGLDANGRVIYVGTLSKVLFPALRLGYLVVPPALVDAAMKICLIFGLHAPILEQAVVGMFFEEGHFARHIRRMRRLYLGRREALLEAAARDLAGALDLRAAEAGIHMLGWLANGVDDRAAAQAARRHGVNLEALSPFGSPPVPGGLVLGYGAPDEAEIGRGVKRLAAALDALV